MPSARHSPRLIFRARDLAILRQGSPPRWAGRIVARGADTATATWYHAVRPARSWPAVRVYPPGLMSCALPVCAWWFTAKAATFNRTLGAKVLASRDLRFCILPVVPA
jgi:hypothetical protein